jgi:hypothetical protein
MEKEGGGGRHGGSEDGRGGGRERELAGGREEDQLRKRRERKRGGKNIKMPLTVGDTRFGREGKERKGKKRGNTLRLSPERRNITETPTVLTVHSGASGPPMRPNWVSGREGNKRRREGREGEWWADEVGMGRREERRTTE